MNYRYSTLVYESEECQFSFTLIILNFYNITEYIQFFKVHELLLKAGPFTKRDPGKISSLLHPLSIAIALESQKGVSNHNRIEPKFFTYFNEYNDITKNI